MQKRLSSSCSFEAATSTENMDHVEQIWGESHYEVNPVQQGTTGAKKKAMSAKERKQRQRLKKKAEALLKKANEKSRKRKQSCRSSANWRKRKGDASAARKEQKREQSCASVAKFRKDNPEKAKEQGRSAFNKWHSIHSEQDRERGQQRYLDGVQIGNPIASKLQMIYEQAFGLDQHPSNCEYSF